MNDLETKTGKMVHEIAQHIIAEIDELDQMDFLRKVLAEIKDHQQCVVNERRAIAERSEKALSAMTF